MGEGGSTEPEDAGTPPTEPPASEEVVVVRKSWGERIRMRLLKTFIALVLGVVLLGLAIIGGLNTGPGHRLVAETIGGLQFQNGMHIEVGRIEGSLYGEMTLHDLSVSDPQGEFLFSPEVKVDWRPFSYLNNHVDVRSATAERMILRRVPHFKATPPSNAPLLPNLDIDVGHLKVDHFTSAKAVSGEERVGTIEGKAHIANGRAQIETDGRLIAIGKGNGGDRFHLLLDAVPEQNRLGIDLDLRAPQNGVITALLGQKQAFALKVKGAGDWQKWNGKLFAKLAGSDFANLDLVARNGTFAVSGPTALARMFTGPTANLLGPRTLIDLQARLDQRRAEVTGQIASDAFTLTPQGTIDLANNRFDAFNLDFVLKQPSALAKNLAGAGLAAHLALDGSFTTPSVNYRLNAGRLVMNGMGLEGLVANGAARVRSDKIMIPVAASVRRITGLDTVAGGKLDNVRLDGDLAIEGTRVLSDNMRLHSDRIDAKLILAADVSKGFYAGAIDGRIDNYRLESVGIFDISTNMDLKGQPSGYALEGTVRARSKKLLNASLAQYLGGNFAASSHVRYGSDGVVHFSGLSLAAPLLTVNGGQGSWSPGGQIALSAQGQSKVYGAIGVRVTGTIANPDAHVTAEHPNLGIGLANLDARVTGAKGGYRLALTGDTDYGPLKADVTLLTGKSTAVQINSANLSGVDFTGRIVQTRAGPFSGELAANGNGVNGVLRLGAEGKYQAVDFNLRASNANFQGPAKLSIGTAIIDGRAVLYDKPLIVADAQLAGTRLGALDISAARILVDYRDGRGKAKAVVEGRSGVPFKLAANADLQPDQWRVALDGRARGQDFKTLSPARIVPGKTGYELLPTTISVGTGKASLSGGYGPGLKIQSRLEGVDLDIVNAFYPGYGIGGKANGSLDFAQDTSTSFPRADARLTLTNFTRTSAAAVSQPVDVNFVGKLLPSGGDARAVIRRSGTVIGRLVATLSPLPPSSGSWSERLFAAPLGGGIRYNGPADTLFSFAGQADQRLAGPIAVAADFSCRVSDPCLNGIVRGKGLTYENQTYGTKLTSMDVSGHFSGNELQLDSLTAKAGDGTITAQGKLSLAAASGYPMDVSVTLDNARLAKSDALSATATGKLHLTKAAGERALVSGEIRLPETRYQIVREGAAEVPRLTGVRFKPRRGPERVTGNEPVETIASAFGVVRLDLTVIAPEKLYVSGMGLESEWSARLNLAGTSAAPVLSGRVSLIRGTLGFAGRSFQIDKGQITFNGGPTIDPTVAISASETVDSIDVNVVVSGQAYNPQVTFTSTPALPQDEVLSRILFGSSVQNLSAIQAIQLASSLNSLRGTGGGLNPLGKLRSAAGIDRLRILGADKTTGRGTALAAGQYLTDDIYVELITDARGFTATQLEVSLTKWLSVLSQAGGSGVNSLSVQIKKDY